MVEETFEQRRSRATVKTYRYLRIGIVALAVFLGAAVVVARFGSTGQLGSISQYFYSPVRGVFVGTLVAMGLGLLAIKGRDKYGEDILLNLAGMLAPVVALAPTPRPTSRRTCPWGDEPTGVPGEFVAGVDNNMKALLTVGVLGLVAAWAIAVGPAIVKKKRPARRYVVGLAIGTLVVALFGWWFAERDGSCFYSGAHYAAAVPMFGLIVVVAVINAMRVNEGGAKPKVIPRCLMRWLYAAVAGSMAVVLVAAFVVVGYRKLVDGDAAPDLIFWVEVAILALFSVFWLLQTAHYWDDGVPDE